MESCTPLRVQVSPSILVLFPLTFTYCTSHSFFPWNTMLLSPPAKYTQSSSVNSLLFPGHIHSLPFLSSLCMSAEALPHCTVRLGQFLSHLLYSVASIVIDGCILCFSRDNTFKPRNILMLKLLCSICEKGKYVFFKLCHLHV